MQDDRSEVALAALAGLLDEFRRGRIVDPRLERVGMERHASKLTRRWDRRFPGFPKRYFPYTSLQGEWFRGVRDAYLKNIIVQLLGNSRANRRALVNPACVIGRHARDLARRLRSFRVIATDIDPRGNWWYGSLVRTYTPGNFEFVKDDIFCPQVNVRPTAVVFFGACGAVSDGAIDFAIRSRSLYLMCRTCCHDNIGGNTVLTPRPTLTNWFYRLKNWGFSMIQQKL